MNLTALGAQVAQRGAQERAAIANKLMQGADIAGYTRNAICYDTVAYVRYLLGAAIGVDQLLDTSAQNWRALFDFPNGIQWAGDPIPAGTAVGFERVGDQVFHAALAIGGTTIRGVNGGTLGTGWQALGDRDLVTLPGGAGGVYTHDGTQINVWLSNL